MVGGLALFLYGLSRLATSMRVIAGDRMKRLVAKATTNRFAGIATGTVATAVLDSSSITIIMVIAMVDAQLLTFVQSLGVILGANIGTTVSSQIIALDVERYSPLVLVIGLAVLIFGRTEKWRHAGIATFGMGLIFFGLGQMGMAVEPLKNDGRFAELMTRLESPLLGIAAGALTTLVIQSSSATVGIAITLASQGLLTLPAGVAIMLGAEIGTCADTLLATIGRSRAAVRAGIFHLTFNITTVSIGALLLGPLTSLAVRMGGGIERQIANAHVAFNLLGVIAVVFALSPIAKLLEKLLPSREQENTGATGITSETLALDQGR
ncbi:MAG: Na/Pi cotransporter family protein [Phycisphaerae bacterium]|nr:Na/Pi cotransporter family protein [Gemmatimonadaceae bacterium]